MRKFDSTFMEDIRIDIESGAIPMLIGEPGIGKSSWVEALARTMGAHYFCLSCNQFADKADVTGARLVPIEKADGTQTYQQQFYPYKVIDCAIDCAKENPDDLVLLFMDEINRTTPDVTSELLSIPTARTLGDVRLPDNVRVIAAGNDHGNVTALDEASISRFALYRVMPDVDTFIEANPNLYGPIKKVLLEHPDTLFCKEIVETVDTDDDDDSGILNLDDILSDDDGQSQITTPRTISKLSDWFNLFLSRHTTDDLLERMNDSYADPKTGRQTNALVEKIESNVGHTLFSAHLISEIADSLVRVNTAPTNVNMPMKPSYFEDLMTAKTRDDLIDMIEGLGDKARAHAAAWALVDTRDCSLQITELARQLTAFGKDDNAAIMSAFMHDSMNMANAQAFVDAHGPLSDAYGALWSLR